MTDMDKMKELKEKERILKEAADSIRVQEKDLPRVVERFQKELIEMKDKLSNHSDEN